MNSIRIVVSIIILAALWFPVSGCTDQLTEAQRVSSANQAYEQGRYRDALIRLKNILQSNPRNKDARLLLGRTNLKLGDADAALKEFLRARELGATAEEYYVLSLESKLKLGNNEEIIESFNTIDLQSEDTRQVASIYYAEALYRIGDSKIAAETYRAVIETATEIDTIRRAHLGLGNLQLTMGEIAEATESIQKAYGYDENAPETLIVFGQLLLGESDFKGAQKLFAKGRDISAVSVENRIILTAGEVEAALGLNDVDASKRAANRLFEVAPEHPVTNYLLGRVAYLDGDKPAAFEYLQASLAKAPRYRPAQLFQGVLSFERKEFEQAEMFLKGVLGAQPGNAPARKFLAEVYLEMDQPEKAVSLLKEAIASGKADQQMVGMLSRASMRIDNGDSSIAYLQGALDENPESAPLQQALVAAYVTAGRAAEALELLEGSDAKIDDRRKEIVKLLAAVQAKDLNTARSQAEIITSRWPDDAQTNNIVGGWYFTQGEFDKARELFGLVYAESSNDLNALTNLGRIDLLQKNYAEARARYEEFLTRNPESEVGLMAISYVYQIEGDSATALSYIKRAHELNPTSEAPLTFLVRILVLNKDFEEAAEYAEKAVAANPQSARALHLRGVVEMNRGNYENAHNSLLMAAELDSDSFVILRSKARAEVALKMYERARDSFEQLWEIDSADLETARALVQLEIKLGRPDQAKSILETLKLDRPGDSSVFELEGDMYKMANEPGAALKAYKRAYTMKPSRKLAMKQYRQAESSGDNALAYLTDWLAVSPDDVAIRGLVAQNLLITGNSSQAISEYEELLRSKPDSPLVLNNLAWLYFEQSDSESKVKAVALSKKAYGLASSNAQIADTYGWLLLRSGETDSGLKLLAEAETLAREKNSPDLNNIIYHHAVALDSSGDQVSARNRLQEILGGTSDFSSRNDAQLLLDSL